MKLPKYFRSHLTAFICATIEAILISLVCDIEYYIAAIFSYSNCYGYLHGYISGYNDGKKSNGDKSNKQNPT